MRIVFFGSSGFAVPCLEKLITAGYKPLCAVTQPDRKKGRGLRLETTPVKAAAKEYQLEVYQPESINAPGSLVKLKGLSPDLFVVVAYGQILSGGILEIPGKFSLNIHASLLPKYRGASPINWAIINGEKVTGVTAMQVIEKMDAGPIIAQKELAIEDQDTAVTLENRLAVLGAGLLLESVRAVEAGSYNLLPQDESSVTFAPKIRKEDGLIHWNRPAQEIYNLIRGCMGWPGAFTYHNGKLLKIHKAKIVSDIQGRPGEIKEAAKKKMVVSAGKGALFIEELQMEGAKRMSSAEFISGHKLNIGKVLG